MRRRHLVAFYEVGNGLWELSFEAAGDAASALTFAKRCSNFTAEAHQLCIYLGHCEGCLIQFHDISWHEFHFILREIALKWTSDLWQIFDRCILASVRYTHGPWRLRVIWSFAWRALRWVLTLWRVKAGLSSIISKLNTNIQIYI